MTATILGLEVVAVEVDVELCVEVVEVVVVVVEFPVVLSEITLTVSLLYEDEVVVPVECPEDVVVDFDPDASAESVASPTLALAPDELLEVSMGTATSLESRPAADDVNDESDDSKSTTAVVSDDSEPPSLLPLDAVDELAGDTTDSGSLVSGCSVTSGEAVVVWVSADPVLLNGATVS